MDDFEKEVKNDFLNEAISLLNDAEQAFLALEGDKNNLNLMNEIFRLAHNLKGTSRAVGFGDVAEFTHEFENLILKLKENKLEVNDFIVSLLLECNDHVTNMIHGLLKNLDARFDSKAIILKIQNAHELEDGPKITEVENDSISAEDVEILRIFEMGLNSNEEERPFKSEILDIKFQMPIIENRNDVFENNTKKNKKQAISEDESIRVSLSRVEELNNVVGELVIIQTVLSQLKDSNIGPLMQKSLSQLGKLSKEIQTISMSLRMIPLKQTFLKMQRIVRDTSKSLDKKVNLEIFGEETEIDKTVLEHLSDPLVHIIRNAIDHGLESNELRLQRGKPEIGTISIKAVHEGNNLVIEISDNGNGIDANIIRQKAIEKNIIFENSQLSDDELVNLIFHPGFSTKAEVTEVSGRGVGMDVVKTNIEKLSGIVKISTVVGSGSVFKVVLPLTLAIIEAMVTRLENDRYIIPLAQIHETLSPTKDLVHYVTGVGHCLKLRGQVIPLFTINSALKMQIKERNINEQIAIIVNTSERKFAVLVDDILHQQQVVIKKLGDEILNQKGFMGSSILGDGKPALILDLIELFSGSMKEKKISTLNSFAA